MVKKIEQNQLIWAWSWLNKITRENICIIIAIDYQKEGANDVFCTGLSAFFENPLAKLFY